jgi:hypothetical protein
MVRQAPFPARPDTLRAGDLLGPFDGVVTDAETERPLRGATVAVTWAFERGVGLTGPLAAREFVTLTGADGRYRIPLLRDLPGGLSTHLGRVTLIVYQREYVGWRSDGVFPDGATRQEFSQRGHHVKLARWKPGYRHHRHLLFLGGGESVRAAAAWEASNWKEPSRE